MYAALPSDRGPEGWLRAVADAAQRWRRFAFNGGGVYNLPRSLQAGKALEANMAKRGPRQLVRMRSTESHHVYLTTKNRRNNDKRLELRKYDPVLRKHVVYRETR